jgi:sugar lactone lactonase YvrE
MATDLAHDLLFVAGGMSGQAYVYDTRTGATVATYQLTTSATTVINDVTVTKNGAWFTDSLQAQLYFIPVGGAGALGPSRTLRVCGPAADLSGEFNLNSIAATANGKTLVVAHSGTGQLYTVDPTSGVSAAIAGVGVPFVDGIVLEAGRLWAVQNFLNQVSRIRLAPDLASGVVEEVITSALFQVPTTAARFGSRLAVVNAKFRYRLPAHRRPVRGGRG